VLGAQPELIAVEPSNRRESATARKAEGQRTSDKVIETGGNNNEGNGGIMIFPLLKIKPY
jgi:hypothetical protein